MKIGFLQYNPSWENKEENKIKILALLEKSYKKMDLLILPEMTLSGFSQDLSRTTLDESDFAFFKNLSQKYRLIICFGGVQDNQNKLFIMNKNGRIICEYAKINLFYFAKEHHFYEPGKRMKTFKLKDFRITPVICFDLRYPTIFWSKGIKTDLFIVIASWPEARKEHWLTLLKARAIENQCYVVGVNRIGEDPKFTYSGNSVIIDPQGKTILSAGSKEGLFTKTLDKKAVKLVRRTFPIFRIP